MTTTHPDPGTLRQFAERLLADFCQENPSQSKAEYRRLYPTADRADLWLRAVENAARFGTTLSRATVDCLYKYDIRAFWSLWHHWPNAFPLDYLNPAIRGQLSTISTKRHTRRTAGESP